MKTSIFIIIFSLLAAMVSAQNANIKRIGPTTFSVGAYDHPFRFEHAILVGTPPTFNATTNAELQLAINAALTADWAACIMMVLNYNGLNVSQEQVLRLNGNDAAEAMNSPQALMFAINKTSRHDWGPDSKIYSAVATLDPDVIFDELSAGRPLILGTGSAGMEGRAFVVTAMSYTIKFDANGQQTGITPQTVTLRDPWPAGLANHTVNWTDFLSLTASLYTVKVVFK